MSAKAGTVAEGGATDLEGFDWATTGDGTVTATEAQYAALEEPGAGADNRVEYTTRENLKRLNAELGSVESRVDTLESDVQTLSTSYGSHTHDSRYYTKSESDSRFFTQSELDARYINEGGDTIDGHLYSNGLTTYAPGLTVETDQATATIGRDWNAGPHKVRFGSGGARANHGLDLNYYNSTGSERLVVEHRNGNDALSVHTDTQRTDFHKNPVQNFVLETVSSRPSNPVVGQMIYNTSQD